MSTRFTLRLSFALAAAAGTFAPGCATGAAERSCPNCGPGGGSRAAPAVTHAERSGHDGPIVLGADWTTVRTSDDTYEVRYRSRPSSIPLNESFDLEVEVPSGDASVSLSADAAMPEHGHGMNVTPRVRSLGDGRFLVSGMLFHMPGYWEIYLDVTRGGVTERAQFSVTLD